MGICESARGILGMRKNLSNVVAVAAALSMVMAVPVSAKSADDFDDVHRGDWE